MPHGTNFGNGWTKATRASANRRRSRVRVGKYSVHKGRSRGPKPERVVEYAAYIASPDWAEKRRLFFADPTLPKTCMGCGCDEVDLHHLTYERLGCELLTDLVPLCRDCHRRVHKMDPLAGKAGGLAALRKSLIYDLGIGTNEVEVLIAPYRRAWKK